MKVRLGISPLCWMNPIASGQRGSFSFEDCLSEAALIGYRGIEGSEISPPYISHTKAALRERELELSAGQIAVSLLSDNFLDQLKRFNNHLVYIKDINCENILIAESSFNIRDQPYCPLKYRPHLNLKQQRNFYKQLDAMALQALDAGIQPHYMPLLGTVIQDSKDIEDLLDNTQHINIVFNPALIALTEADYFYYLQYFYSRIRYLHCSNLRFSRLSESTYENQSIMQILREGIFTVPGDRGIDYDPIFKILNDREFDGWCIVIGEQDPQQAHPFTYARLGFAALQVASMKSRLAKTHAPLANYSSESRAFSQSTKRRLNLLKLATNSSTHKE